ncbi:GNAT family N-acetyltransferase [Streptomyces sp. NPDC008125]|uniref:GNAT family N-acetyltransferase n=1 Tax=Streptomyces sp. NPDC008125 TaxID=3364811 RepID=UPI0036E600EC
MTATGAETRIRITVADSLASVGHEAWTELVTACGAGVFQSYDFLRSVESDPLTYPSAASYLLAHTGAGDLVAALPVYLQQTRDPFATGPGADTVLNALVGHVWHCYDTRLLHRGELTVLLVEQFWQALEDLAAEYRAELWGLANVALREPLAEHLTAIGVPVEETAPRYRLPIAGGPATLDEHLAGIGRSSRRSLRQSARRAERSGARSTLRTGRDALDQDVLDLCLGTANKHAPGYYPPDRLGALIERLGESCQILRIDLGGTLLATSICLYDDTRMHAWAGGCLYPAELNWSPQYALFEAELRAGFGSGRPVLECGRRNDEFKLRYGLQAYPLGRAVRRG